MGAARQRSGGARRAGHKPCVLIVEDDPDFRGQLGEYFDYLGWDRRLARDARAAAAAFSVADPDLILCDVMLPGLDGFETIRHLRGLPGGEEIPVVLMSASWRDPIGFEARLRSVGAVEFLRKPLSIPELGRRLQVILDLDASRRAEARSTRSGQFRNSVVDESLGDCAHGPTAGPYNVLGAAEIVLQIFDQARTGILELTHGSTTRDLVFRDGLLLGADSDQPRESASAALLAVGCVDPSAIPRLLAAHRDTGIRISELAVKRGLCRPGDIAPAIRHQVTSVLHAAVRAAGHYQFAEGEQEPPTAGILRANPVDLLDEVLRSPPGLFAGLPTATRLLPGPWFGESRGPRALPADSGWVVEAARRRLTVGEALGANAAKRAPMLWMLMRLGAVVGDPSGP